MPHHRRIVLHLSHGELSQVRLRQVAEMARLMRLDLFGVYVEDEAVHGLASMPFARELRLPSHEWQPLEADQLAVDFRQSAATARRLLDSVAQGIGVRSGFMVCRGDPSGIACEVLEAHDIVAVTGPARPLEDLALPPEASLLVLPASPPRVRGPIVLVLAGDEAGALPTAVHLAHVTNEVLVLLGPAAGLDDARARVVAAGLPAARLRSRPLTDLTDNALQFALADEGERLLVLDAAALSADRCRALLRVAADRATPVLLVGGAERPSG